MKTLAERKAALRALLRHRQAEGQAAKLKAAGARAARALAAWPPFRQARAVALFFSRGIEPPTGRLIASCRRRGCRVAVPAWDRRARLYRFVWLEAADRLVAGPLGIPQPARTRPVRPGASGRAIWCCSWRSGRG